MTNFLSFLSFKNFTGWKSERDERDGLVWEGFWGVSIGGRRQIILLTFTWFIQHNTGVCMEGVGDGDGGWGENGADGYLRFNQLHSIG